MPSLAGEHEHTIVGYSLVKGIGDGEPIASERFTVGGHEWVRNRPLSLNSHSLHPYCVCRASEDSCLARIALPLYEEH